MSARTGLVVLLGILSGCYNYLPVTRLDPAPGTHVSVQLTDSGTAALAGYLGPDVGQVDGRILTVSPDELELSVVTVRSRGGIEHYWNGATAKLPRGDIATVRERKLALGRSVLFGLTGVGASVALLEAFGVINSGSSSTGTGTPPQ